nr:unnamed protein product [Digitaria exilis]
MDSLDSLEMAQQWIPATRKETAQQVPGLLAQMVVAPVMDGLAPQNLVVPPLFPLLAIDASIVPQPCATLPFRLDDSVFSRPMGKIGRRDARMEGRGG